MVDKYNHHAWPSEGPTRQYPQGFTPLECGDCQCGSVGLFYPNFRERFQPEGRRVDLGNRNKVTKSRWHEKATVCAQLLTGSARLLVAISMILHVVKDWPLY